MKLFSYIMPDFHANRNVLSPATPPPPPGQWGYLSRYKACDWPVVTHTKTKWRLVLAELFN